MIEISNFRNFHIEILKLVRIYSTITLHDGCNKQTESSNNTKLMLQCEQNSSSKILMNINYLLSLFFFSFNRFLFVYEYPNHVVFAVNYRSRCMKNSTIRVIAVKNAFESTICSIIINLFTFASLLRIEHTNTKQMIIRRKHKHLRITKSIYFMRQIIKYFIYSHSISKRLMAQNGS